MKDRMINYFRRLFTACFTPHKFLSAVKPVIGLRSKKDENGLECVYTEFLCQSCYKYTKSVDYHWKDEVWKCVDCYHKNRF